MSYTYEELHKKTIDQLRQIAKDIEHEAVQGFTQMNKEHLLPAICKALGIEAHTHHHVIGVDKTKLKARIHELKQQRDEALSAKDRAKHKAIIREIHGLKRRLRAATV